MPRPILHTVKSKEETNTTRLTPSVSTMNASAANTEQDRMRLDRLLRRPRSKEYMEAMRRLDAGGVHTGTHTADGVLEIVNKEFEDAAEIFDTLLGYVSKCYLGIPYEVHTLDITGNIIKHYKDGEALPGGLEKARGLAIRGGYAFIEVYTNCCRAISEDGTVSVIR